MALRFRPHESLSHITKVLRNYMHLPDPQVLYVTLGTVVGNALPGTPVWTMLIGGPSAGGSTLINALSGYTDKSTQEEIVLPVQRIYALDSVKGEAAFLSASPRKERAKDATGGVLRDIERHGGKGMLVMSDFTNILSLRNEQQAEVISCLRMVYDGKFSRAVGTDGAKVLHWEGQVGCIAKCTGSIESHHQVIGEMGQRFIMWRYTVTRGHSENMKALELRDKRQMDIDIAAAVCDHVNRTLDNLVTNPPVFELEVFEKQWINNASQFICRNRSVVKRDPRLGIVDSVPPPEGPMRLAQEFKSMFLGMQAAGVGSGDAHKALTSMLWGSMQSVRSHALRCALMICKDKGGKAAQCNGFSSDEVAAMVGKQAEVDGYRLMSPSTLTRTMEDLEYLGVLSRVRGKRGQRVEWTLETETQELVKGLRLL